MFMYYRNSVANSDLESGADGNTSVERDMYDKNLPLKEKHIGLSFKLNADGSWIRYYLRALLALRYRVHP